MIKATRFFFLRRKEGLSPKKSHIMWSFRLWHHVLGYITTSWVFYRSGLR